jgi:thiol-disulfide isomerase/thioredoxin
MRLLLFVLLLFSIASCSDTNTPLKPGPWKGILVLDKGKHIPFLMSWSKDTVLTVINAEERIEITDISLFGDSIIIHHPVFEGTIKGTFASDSISGVFTIPSLNRTIPVKMSYGRNSRFPINEAPSTVISGIWETVFSPKDDAERYVAKGVFDQTGNRVTGTFQTISGDYRYLDGVVVNDSVKLSTFDFSHAFLFEAAVEDSTLTGTFYSGNHWKEPFEAVRNESYRLSNPDSLTRLKENYAPIQFSFPNTEGDTISLDDERFSNKAVIVQLMGSWCPNCLDETRFLTEYYPSKPEQVEIVALAFEEAPTYAKAQKRLRKLKNVLNIEYPILLAQFGDVDKKSAGEKLPMLTAIKSYPTTIFIAPNGKVTRIHTGFNGPATGDKFEKFKKDFKEYVSEMISEE